MSLRDISTTLRILMLWLDTHRHEGHPADRALDALRACFTEGGTLFVCGNGGSASQSSHLAAELVGIGLRCISLCADQAVMTALSNDIFYEMVFARQLAVLGKPGDLLLVLSTGGKSNNILRALRVAEACGIKRIALTGNLGNLAAAVVEYPITVPSNNAQRIQEIHLMILHHWYEQLKEHRPERYNRVEKGIA